MLKWTSLLLAALLVSSGCVVGQRPDLSATAQDEWTRTYTLADGGEVEIGAQGSVEIEGVEGNSVDVRVERIAHAATREAAAEIVPRIDINEVVGPKKILVRTAGLSGMVIGVRTETHYHVRAPKRATIRVRGTEQVSVKAFAGRVVVTAVNGPLAAEDISGGIEARSVNGSANVALTGLSGDIVDIRSTNGSVVLTVPANANANLNASATNGTVDVSDVNFEPLGDRSQRRVRGKLNAGGPPIDVTAVNGNVTVKAVR